MTRWFPASAFAFLLLSACVTSQPIHQVGAPDPVTDPRFTGDARPMSDPRVSGDLNPVADATNVGAVDEAARESRERAEAGARTGRRVGVVAGTLAAVLGGPSRDSVEGMVGRYVITRDAATLAGAIIGGVKGGKEGAKRGSELDLQFAELKKIDGLDVTRPTPDRIDVFMETVPNHETLAAISAVFAGHEQRWVDIEAADPIPLDLRDSLIDLGVPESSISVQRNDGLRGVILRIRYQS
ncbi:MAG TPA: hypothetical protein VNN25_01600 [Thermoanaerobaculia bacterium]|nr:hypothetical protein [Thermoanaerobaculia bacterium]